MRWAAEAPGVEAGKDADAGRILADQVMRLMELYHVPNGLRAIGYSSSDIPALVEGTLPQERIVKLCPRPVSAEDLARMFEESMRAW